MPPSHPTVLYSHLPPKVDLFQGLTSQTPLDIIQFHLDSVQSDAEANVLLRLVRRHRVRPLPALMIFNAMLTL